MPAQVPPLSQHCHPLVALPVARDAYGSLNRSKMTALTPQDFIAEIDAWSLGPSKIPLPCTQAYSVPDRSTPCSTTCAPVKLSSLFPDTCNCGALPPPPVEVGEGLGDGLVGVGLGEGMEGVGEGMR